MKIAYLVTDPGIPVLGDKGASVHVRSITSALSSLGHSVKLLATNLEGDNPLSGNINCIQVGDRKKARKRWKWAKHAVAGVKEGIKRPQQQLAEIIKMDIAGRAADEVVKLLRRDPVDLIIERLSPFSGAGMLPAEKLGIPRIVEMNAPLTEETRQWRHLELDEISARIESAALLSAAGVITVSRELKTRLLELPVDRNKILVLPNGFDPGLFFPAPKDRALGSALGTAGKFVIGFAGSLKMWHGLDVLLQAFSRLSVKAPDAALLIIGEGPEQTSLQALAAELGITDKVRFAGRIPHAAVPAHIRLFDIAVAPYNVGRDFYFSPLKIMEYMACGIPVVACGRGEVSRLLRGGKNGLHLPGTDPAALAAALLTLYSDPAGRAALVSQASKTIQTRTWPAVAGRVIRFAGKIMRGDHD